MARRSATNILAMSQNVEWKLNSPPETEVRVDTDVLSLRAPLVRVHRDDEGTWSFDGPGASPRPSQNTVLGAVVGAWPHVAGLSQMDAGDSAVWSWRAHGWSGEFECHCGHCEPPRPADLDRRSWPEDLDPNQLISVERVALSGEIGLTDILYNSSWIALVGPGLHRRTSDKMTPVAVANVIRRWPHTMQALRAITYGRGMRWNHSSLSWHEYVIA